MSKTLSMAAGIPSRFFHPIISQTHADRLAAFAVPSHLACLFPARELSFQPISEALEA
jgi:hypothetical protein